MTLVYLGTSDFAAAVLRAIGEGPYRPALVVTRPDAAKGRGRKVSPPPVAVAANELGIELDQPQSVNDDPYQRGWMIKLRAADSTEVEKLLTAEQYAEQTGD